MDGKEFLTIHDFNGRKDAIERSKATSQSKERQIAQLYSRYWTLGVDHLEELIVADFAQKAKSVIADLGGAADRKYKRTPAPASPSAEPAARPTTAAAPPQPAPATSRPRPPSISGQPDLVSTEKNGGGTPKTFGQTATETLFK